MESAPKKIYPTPCRRTRTAQVWGYFSIVSANLSLRSSSKGVFSMIGTTSSSSYLKFLPVSWFLIPLIISKCVHLNSLPGNTMVAITAVFEWVWITAPAFLMVYAHIKRGVHWLFLSFFSGGGNSRSIPLMVCTNKSFGCIRSFCTADGAM